MDDMVERVAKAIFKVHNDKYDSWEEAGGDTPHSTIREYYFAEARAAIEAMPDPELDEMFDILELEIRGMMLQCKIDAYHS